MSNTGDMKEPFSVGFHEKMRTCSNLETSLFILKKYVNVHD